MNDLEKYFSDNNGVYLCEDLHTSYWNRYGGGYKRSGTFIEYSKNFVDYINAWHSLQPTRLRVSDFTKSVYALHYYDSILVIEKKSIEKPYHLKTGVPQIPDFHPPATFAQRIKRRLNRIIHA